METTEFENPLEKLSSLRQKVDIAETTEQIRKIHQRISQVIDENPRFPLSEIAEALGIKVEKESKGVRLRIYATLKGIRPDIFDTESLPEEIQAIEDKFGEKGVYFKKLDIVITPPDKDSRKITQGSGNGIEDKRIYDRVGLATEVLISMGIDLFKCPPFAYGKITNRMIRNTTYVHIQVPQLNKMIHICDEEGNRTFVIYTCENEEKYIEMRKDKLKEDPLVRNFIWTDNVDEWKMRLLALLQNPIQPDDNNDGNSDGYEDKEEPTPDKPLEIKKMDREYFENSENVSADLEAFATQLVEDKTPLDLRTQNISKLEITCINREIVKGPTYLNRAGVALGLAKNQKEAQSKHAELLLTLLRIGEFEIMDREYFTKKNVRADMEAFAKQLGDKRTPKDLYPASILKLEITYANKEKFQGQTYLCRTGVALGLAKNQKEAQSKQAEIFKTLLKIGGFEKMDKEYFTPENIRTDLEAFTKQLGDKKKPIDLRKTRIAKLKITCTNGERIKGLTYLHRAGVALGLAKDIKEAYPKFVKILSALLKIGGFEIMDREYFTQKNVRADLEALAQQFGKNKSPIDLTAYNIIKKRITCTNGEKTQGETYINRAGIALGMAKSVRETSKIRATILKTLLKIGGFEITEYSPMDKKYFTQENVRADLEAFAQQLGNGKTPLNLSTSKNNIPKLKIKCANEEKVQGPTYLNRAGVALKLAKNTREAISKHAEILKILKKIAGH